MEEFEEKARDLSQTQALNAELLYQLTHELLLVPRPPPGLEDQDRFCARFWALQGCDCVSKAVSLRVRTADGSSDVDGLSGAH